ncbi:Z1 domain-containing protein [Rhizobium leguminosarum]|uniref:Z1 domain-containing protein n=1 Tax=Rhizobium leguminosarum TaxID=384 RepID=UPI0036DDB759
MAEQYDAALAVAQILIGNALRDGMELTPAIIRAQAASAAAVLGAKIDVDQLSADLAEKFRVFVGPASVLVDDSSREPWLPSVERTAWKYWPRYEKLLLHTMPQSVVARSNSDTDLVLGLLGDPSKAGSWDRRGLVVGEVQSGKTTNYTALVCKAADAGYKVIVVLAGVHESLRMQTQIRLDEGFLGRRTDTGALIGVGMIDPSAMPISATTRSLRGDFNKAVSRQLDMPLNSGPPLLLVVKKNAKTLLNVRNFLAGTTEDVTANHIRGIPLLVIDDESDHASVDTLGQPYGSDDKPDPNFEPTAINGAIRQILRIFEQKAYVGYTATPFANIFIHHRGLTDQADRDLFPRNFIVNLHPPSNYFGATRAFGLDQDRDVSDGNALVRTIDGNTQDTAQLNAWMPARHKQSHRPAAVTEDGFPSTLRRAILSFLLGCAIRKLRGQLTEHNSMLVHVTRFTRLQQIVVAEIDQFIAKVRRALRYEPEGPGTIWEELERLLNEDFRPTTARLVEGGLPDIGRIPEWSTIAPTMADVADNVRLKEINGQALDVLDYENFKGVGVDVIAVGGDKLSRGLTLEGLTVSYFARQTDMYDTLLQMGRWFGYRPGYLDLCRLYTTDILKKAFEHIAVASDELRREFDFMQSLNIRPIEYGLKVRSHTTLKPTSAGKRKHTSEIVVYETYAGKVSETKSFSLDKKVLENNRDALSVLVATLKEKAGLPRSPSYGSGSDGVRSYDRSALWENVSHAVIINFLADYETEPVARLANSKLWINYIQEQREFQKQLELWNVALINGDQDGRPHTIEGIELNTRIRRRDADVSQGDGYRIKRLVTNRDVGIDLEVDAWNLARDYDPQGLLGDPRREPTSQGNCWARAKLGLNPLLLIYLPEPSDYENKLPIVGAAIAFPGSENAARTAVRYTVNTVYIDEIKRGEKIEL